MSQVECFVGSLQTMAPVQMLNSALILASPFAIVLFTWAAYRTGKLTNRNYPRILPIFENSQRRFIYAIFWSLVASNLILYIKDPGQLPIPLQCLNTWQLSLAFIANIFCTSLIHFPLIASFSSDSFFGYTLATLWTLAIGAARILRAYQLYTTESISNNERSVHARLVTLLMDNFLPVISFILLFICFAIRMAMAFKVVISMRRFLIVCSFPFDPLKPWF